MSSVGTRKPRRRRLPSGSFPKRRRDRDAELVESVLNPAKGDFLIENTRTGILVDGNGRAHELLRRMADPSSSIKPDTQVPVLAYTPDLSMFPDLD